MRMTNYERVRSMRWPEHKPRRRYYRGTIAQDANTHTHTQLRRRLLHTIKAISIIHFFRVRMEKK